MLSASPSAPLAIVTGAARGIGLAIAEWFLSHGRKVMTTNLDGAFLCSQPCVPYMLKVGRGAIVNIASIWGLRAGTVRVAHGTSKAALIQFPRQRAARFFTLETD